MLARVIIVGIRVYQVALSPFWGQCCRFLPTCSEYTIEAIVRYGAWRGLCLSVRRLARCHPWGASGHDPVP